MIVDKNVLAGDCPECDAEIVLKEGTLKGEIPNCPECKAELEIVRLDYIVLFDLAPEEKEDWGE